MLQLDRKSCVDNSHVCEPCLQFLTYPFLSPSLPLSLSLSLTVSALSGKRTVRVKEVPLAASSLTQGDVYILDAALKIYIFNGPSANMFEKTKGTVSERAGARTLVF